MKQKKIVIQQGVWYNRNQFCLQYANKVGDGELIPYVRKQKIIAALEKTELLYVEQLAELLGISISTVRRDVRRLAEEGMISALRGGAVKLKRGSYDTPLETKQLLNSDRKQRIARYAASLVATGDAIYLDSGTSVLYMAKYLRKKKITVVTSNTKAVDELLDSAATLITLGGEINKQLGSVVGSAAEMMLRSMYFDKAFLGASGYSLLGGVSTPDAREAMKKTIVHERSKDAYVLADASKAGMTSFCKAFDLSDAVLITDEENDCLKDCKQYFVV